jgi:hypothetical protein
MFSSPVFYAWLAWLLARAAFAVIRYQARQHEEQQREDHRRQREAQHEQHPGGAVCRQARRSALPADYRDQLVAPGITRPVPDPEITPDPATSV